MANLGLAYMEGKIVEQDLPKAELLLQDAYDVGIMVTGDNASETWTKARRSKNYATQIRHSCEEDQHDWCGTIEVLYATNRTPLRTEDGSQLFGFGVDDKIHFGRSTEIILGNRQEVSKSNSLRQVLDKFFSSVRSSAVRNAELSQEMFFKILAENDKDVLVFIHGFNNEFDDATRRMASFSFNTEFDGIPVVFSWPAKGGGVRGAIAYFGDYSRQKNTCPSLVQVLGKISSVIGSHRKITVIAHSMGSELLFSALTSCAYSNVRYSGNLISEIILAAPDIGTEDFRKHIRGIRTAGGARYAIRILGRSTAFIFAKSLGRHTSPRISE